MKTLKLLWLYDDLLDLYGDSGNIRVLTYHLWTAGMPFQLLQKSVGDDIDFSDVDFIYIGPGMLSNLLVAMADFSRHKQAFAEAIEKGTPILVTGCARAMLGGELTTLKNGTVSGLGLFDESSTEQPKIEIVDVLCKKPGSETLYYGFVNRTMQTVSRAASPLFEIVSGTGDTPDAKQEGLRVKNLIATWLMGPVLAKNPELLKQLLDLIVGGTFPEYDDALERKAKELTIAEVLENKSPAHEK